MSSDWLVGAACSLTVFYFSTWWLINVGWCRHRLVSFWTLLRAFRFLQILTEQKLLSEIFALSRPTWSLTINTSPRDSLLTCGGLCGVPDLWGLCGVPDLCRSPAYCLQLVQASVPGQRPPMTLAPHVHLSLLVLDELQASEGRQHPAPGATLHQVLMWGFSQREHCTSTLR